MTRTLTPIGILLLLATSCVQDVTVDSIDVQLEKTVLRLSASGDLSEWRFPDENNLAAIPAGAGNQLTKEKVALGKLLFYETALGRNSLHSAGRMTFSCSSCHVPEAGFTAGRIQGIADGAQAFGINGDTRQVIDHYEESEIDAQGARPLSMLAVAYVQNSMWNGSFGAHHNNVGTEELWGVADPSTEVNHLGLDGLEAQNIEGTVVHRMTIDNYVLDTLGYRILFDKAFGDWPGNARYGRVAFSFALSAYLRTLLPNRAPWQEWLKGDHYALTEAQKRGALLFFGKAGCYRCHQGPALNGNEFHAVGVKDLSDVGGLRTGLDDLRNLGRGGFTQRPEDNYRFKVPQLYNVGDMPFYFHGSSHDNLRELVEYFNAGVPENPRIPSENISPYFHPLDLNPAEVDDLVDFLDNGLRDAELRRYVPDAVLSGNCFPNNDPQSRRDLGCE